MNLPKPTLDRETAMELWISERSDYAKEQVILNNVGLIGFALKSLKLNPLDEDLQSIGIIGLVEAINEFDTKRGCAFGTYAVQVVRNQMLNTFRKKRIIPSFSLDEAYHLENGKEVCYADMVEDGRKIEEEVIADIQSEQIFESLSEREKQIIYLKMEGKTQQQIAKICGLSQPQVSRIIKNAYKKCKRKFMEE